MTGNGVGILIICLFTGRNVRFEEKHSQYSSENLLNFFFEVIGLMFTSFSLFVQLLLRIGIVIKNNQGC